ncbi:glycosyltransferase [Spirosoma flavum]|uniref:Glycosyltransferase n=1 Tax=Spirosoma flavum TaxID=2048557 RepID=A0ABW6ALB8_9BACT
MGKGTPGVLQVIHGEAFGGVESWLIHILPLLLTAVKVKILICDKHIHPVLRHTFEQHRIAYLHLPITAHVLDYNRQLFRNRAFFDDIDCVHCHVYFKSVWPLPFFKVLRKHVILHNHAAATAHIKTRRYRLVFGVLKQVLNLGADTKIAVSEQSYRDLFGRKTPRHGMMPCGVCDNPTDEFLTHCSQRQQRKPTNRITLLHIGRFYESAMFEDAKNQEFIVAILAVLKRMQVDFDMLFVGEGDNKAIRHRIEQLGFSEHVQFVAYTADKLHVFAKADVFLFPSRHEGYGMSLVEAQLAGCPCCVSDAIPDEAIFTDNVTRLSLSDSAETWAAAVLARKNAPLSNTYNAHIQYASLPQNARELLTLYTRCQSEK